MAGPEYLNHLVARAQASGIVPPGVISVIQIALAIAADIKLGEQYRSWIFIGLALAVVATWIVYVLYRRWYGFGEVLADSPSQPGVGGPMRGGWLVGARQLGPDDMMFDPDNAESRSLFALVASPDFRIGSLWGPAGVGKSSLLQKGLRELSKGRGWCLVFVPQPGRDPVARCIDVLRTMVSSNSAPPTTDAPARQLTALLNTVGGADKSVPDRQQILVIFDQFEQFLIANPDEHVRRNLFQPIAEAASGAAANWPRVLIALRKEFVADLDALAEFQTGISNPEWRRPLLPWSRNKASAFLHRIVDNHEAGFSDQLIEAIATDLDLVNSPVANAGEAGLSTGVLPIQLQLVARVLKDRRVRTLAEYEGGGRAVGALRSVVRDTLSPPGTDPKSPRVRIGNHLVRVLCERDHGGARLILTEAQIVQRIAERYSAEGDDGRSRAQIQVDVRFQLERLQSRTLVISPDYA